MAAERPFVLVQSDDQWLRCSHEDTALLDGAVQLYWEQAPPPARPGASADALDGIAFDCWGRLYRTLAAEGRVVVTPRDGGEPRDLFESRPAQGYGDFQAHDAGPADPLEAPSAVAVDDAGFLYVAERGARRLLTLELETGRLRQRTLPAAPLDLAARGSRAVVLLEDAPWLVEIDGLGREPGPPLVKPSEAEHPRRIAVAPADGRIYLLDRARAGPASVFAVGDDGPLLAGLDGVRDLALLEDAEPLDSGERPESRGILVLARRSGEPFLRFRILPDGSPSRLEPLAALGYRGDGIARGPANRAVYFVADGLREAYRMRVRYRREGRVASFRLDSGAFHTRWGRLFLDACIPAECRVEAAFLTADEPLREIKLEATLPANRTEPPDWPGATREDWPPPPARWIAETDYRPLHRRGEGRELAFVRPAAGDPFDTYEAPIAAPAGRYLWVLLRLTGSAKASPRVRSLRAEHAAHSLLRRLPKTLSRDQAAGDFLHAYLASLEGSLNHLERIAEKRRVLLHAGAAPAEVLPWLAGFVGLTLDERWSERARRTAIREAICLFRRRGTKEGLRRMIEIYIETPVLIIEKFQLRGLGAGLLGGEGDPRSSAILGGGFRVGGQVGVEDSGRLDDGRPDEAFETHAHRFGVVIPAPLSAEQLDVVRHIVEWNKPAHTINEFDVCTIDAAFRIGRGAHVGLTTIVGRSEWPLPTVLGSMVVGRGQTLGGAGAPQTVVGGRLDEGARVS